MMLNIWVTPMASWKTARLELAEIGLRERTVHAAADCLRDGRDGIIKANRGVPEEDVRTAGAATIEEWVLPGCQRGAWVISVSTAAMTGGCCRWLGPLTPPFESRLSEHLSIRVRLTTGG